MQPLPERYASLDDAEASARIAVNEIVVPEAIAEPAGAALMRMLEVSRAAETGAATLTPAGAVR